MPLPIHYINLDRARDRRAFMERQARRWKLDLIRQRAVEAQEISSRDHHVMGECWERPITRVELALFFSHRLLWQEVLNTGRPAIILEDDAVFSERFGNFVEIFGEATEKRDKSACSFDLINLESMGRRKFVRPPAYPISNSISLLPVIRDKSGSAAYVLMPEGAKKLLANAERLTAPVDAYLFSANRLKMAQVVPPMVMQVHLLHQRGIDPGLVTTTSIHQPRARLPFDRAHLKYALRRAGTQMSLMGLHLKRAGAIEYRMIDIEPADFTHRGI